MSGWLIALAVVAILAVVIGIFAIVAYEYEVHRRQLYGDDDHEL